MQEQLVKVIIDLSKPEGEREILVPLPPEEIANGEEFERARKAAEAEQEAAAQAIDDLKSSARAKLVAGTPLTEEEAAVLVL